MTTNILSYQSQRNIQIRKILEPFFFGYLIYSSLSVPFKIFIPSLAGAWLLGLSIVSFLVVEWRKRGRIFILLVAATASLHLLIQYFVHEMPVSAPYNQPFLFWPIQAMIIYVLATKPGFINRLVFVMFVITLALKLNEIILSAPTNALFGLTADNRIEEANSYAASNAFSSLVFWLGGWKTANKRKRLFLWGCALVALLLGMETTSRGALLELSVACIFGLRGIPRKYWFGIILGVVILFLILDRFSFFYTNVQNYQNRLYEDTGRSAIWSSAIKLIWARPWLGYGTGVLGGYNKLLYGLGTILPFSTPHNPFLLLWLGSGFFPVITFSILWLITIIKSSTISLNHPLDIDALPLISFSFIYVFLSNLSFTSYWVIACMAYCYIIKQVPRTVSKESRLIKLHQKVKINVPTHSPQ